MIECQKPADIVAADIFSKESQKAIIAPAVNPLPKVEDLDMFINPGEDPENIDISGCLSGAVLVGLGAYGIGKALSEKGKQRRCTTVTYGSTRSRTVEKKTRSTISQIEALRLGRETEKNVGKIDFMAESKAEERKRQDKDIAAWKEIEKLDEYSTYWGVEKENDQIRGQIEPGWQPYGKDFATVCEGGRPVLFIDPKRPKDGGRAVVLTEEQRNDPRVKKWLKTLIPQK